MHTLQQVVYTGTATATGGREGTAKSSDGSLDVTLTTPKVKLSFTSFPTCILQCDYLVREEVRKKRIVGVLRY